MTTIKSKLQTTLEKEGWSWLTNEPARVLLRNPQKSDEEIRQMYLQRKFKEVRIEDAYDSESQPLSSYRAVYIKR
ncbi:MAG: hypothetical protein AABW51_05220 [Nanoarchaeota archaeon]